MSAIQQEAASRSVLDSARELTPLIVQCRQETEHHRLPAAPIVARLRTLRLCRLALGTDLHGHAMPVHEALDVYEQLSYAEASVGWIVWNNALPCMMSRFLEPAARGQVFGIADSIFACSTRPTGRATEIADGYRVNGRWTIVSGCELAEWIMLICVVEERGEPGQRCVFVRRGNYEIVDTWHVGGLRGTGSHDILVNDLMVPRALTFSPDDPSKLNTPLGRVAIVCSMAAAYGAQALGIARLAIEAVTKLARAKESVEGGPAMRENPQLLALIARHTAILNAARAYLQTCASDLWRTAVAGRPADLGEITATWRAAIHAAEAAQDAVAAAYAAGGIDSLYTSSPLERAHRDMYAMRRHIVGQALWLEDAGRVMLDQVPKHPLYAV
jgi:alkylation response protein AidB-like acyl-CoA dehydrogenase